MPLVRALAIVLVAVVGAGSTLLDSCVLGCQSHVHANQTAPPEQHTAHCHQGAASGDRPEWQATSTCNHDHGEWSADVGAQPRPDAGSRTGSLIVSLRSAVPIIELRPVSLAVGGADINLHSQSPTFLSPLRL